MLLTGCAAGPDYVRPDVAMPASYKNTVPLDAPAQKDWKLACPADSEPRTPWWEVYGDTQLNALETRVIGANQTVAAAAARFRGVRCVLPYDHPECRIQSVACFIERAL